MPDDPDPPRKFYGLKAREFERVNKPEPDAPGMNVEDHFRAAAAPPRRREPPLATTPAENDVHDLLRQNVERERAAGLDRLKSMEPRQSRRKRDFLMLLAAGNGVLLGVLAFGLSEGNAFIMGSAGAGMLLFTIGVTWIMWGVMSDY